MLKTGYEDYPQYNSILGIDEVGFGCGAGDLYVTGVILPKDYSNSELKDSKKLSEKKRDRIYDDLMAVDELIKYTTVVPVEFINGHGMAKAIKVAFQDIIDTLYGKYDCVFIDGIDARDLKCKTEYITVVKGDNTYQNIASASIIAKVERDRYMINESINYPAYQLEKNKGYLTQNHIKAIKEHGGEKIHRTQYIRNFV